MVEYSTEMRKWEKGLPMSTSRWRDNELNSIMVAHMNESICGWNGHKWMSIVSLRPLSMLTRLSTLPPDGRVDSGVGRRLLIDIDLDPCRPCSTAGTFLDMQ